MRGRGRGKRGLAAFPVWRAAHGVGSRGRGRISELAGRSQLGRDMKRRCALVLAALAISPFGCGGATTSTPPAPQPLEVDAGVDDVDASEQEDASASSETKPDAGDADASVDASVVLTECPGFVEPDEFASCSQNSMNNQCNVTCRSGGRLWQSQCRDGVCSCAMGIEVKCTCTMLPGGCQSCCPGMGGS